MENIKKFPRGIRIRSLAESCFTSDGGSISMAARALDPGLVCALGRKASSFKHQAPSFKHQAPEASSDKRQAPSSKRQA